MPRYSIAAGDRRPSASSLLAGALLLAVLGASPAASQEGVFGDTIDVRVVDVEVVVTDRDGQRVPGLTQADFRLLVGGKEVPVESFQEVRDGVTVAAPAAVDAGPAAPQDTAGAGEVVPLNYLVFVDELTSPVHLRSHALKQLAAEARHLRREDRMALVAFDGRQLKMLAHWTRPSAGLARLLEAAARRKGALAAAEVGENRAQEGEQEFIQETALLLGRFGDDFYAPFADADVDQARRELRQIDAVVAAAAAAQRAFGSPPGRKVMIVVSGGWEFDQTLEAGGPAANNLGRARGGPQVLRPLTDTSNGLGYTLYPFHLTSPTALLPDAGGDRTPELGAELDSTGWYAAATRHLALATVADETGGRLLPIGVPRPLERIAADARTYYRLGFTFEGGDDHRRPITVEVRRPGLDARSRSSFLPQSRGTKASMDVEGALLAGRVPGMAPLEVALGQPRRAGLGLIHLPVTILIPMDRVTTFEQEDGRWVARLELRVAVVDRDGGRSAIPVTAFEVSSPAKPAPGLVVAYEPVLTLRRKRQDLQLSLFDTLGETHLTARVSVEP